MAKGGPLGFEETLWKAADKLPGSMDATPFLTRDRAQLTFGVVLCHACAPICIASQGLPRGGV